MAKRGRKPNPNKKKEYFSDEEEMAVIMYLKTEDSSEKNRIYNEILKPAFEKMAESIIRRYKLYVPEETFDETFNDAISFIITKADKYRPIIFSYKEVEKKPNSTKKTYKEIRQEEFDVLNEDVCEDSPSLIKFYDYDLNEDRYFEKTRKKYKAYSYYGTICKNYLIGKIQTYNKGIIRNESYDENVGLFIDSINYSDCNEKSRKIASNTVDMLIDKIGVMVKYPEKYALKDSEVKLGLALKNLLENWDFVLTTDGSNKLNKNAILFFLKDSTGFDTKGIRDNMKKYKNVFLSIKEFLLS